MLNHQIYKEIMKFFQVQEAILNEREEKYNQRFTRQELEVAPKDLKSTTPGLDSIRTLFLKNMTEEYRKYFLRVINKSWDKESFPKRWKVDQIIPIINR